MTASRPSIRLRVSLHVAILVGLILGVYARSLDVPFVFDDAHTFARNPALRSFGAWLASGGITDPRAVSMATFALDGSLHGGTLAGYHLTNLLLHLSATIAAYATVRVMLRTPPFEGSPIRERAGLVALGTAALFAAHPLQTQAVVYVVQRMASIAALLYLVSVLSYVRAHLSTGGWPRAAWYACSLFACGAALLAKQNAVTLPVTLVLVEGLFLRGRARRFVGVLPHAAAAATVGILALAPGGAMASASLAHAGAETPLWAHYVLTQASVHLAYLRMLAVPTGQSIDHAPEIARSLLEPRAAAATLAMGGLTALAAWALRTAKLRDPAWRLVAFAVPWWLVTSAVESCVPLPDVMVEHRVYLPSFGVFLAVAAGAALAADARRWPRARVVVPGAFAAWVAILAGVAHARVEVWRDDAGLWADAARKAPHSARPYFNLGGVLLDRGQVAEALPPLREALRLEPASPIVHDAMADALLRSGNPSLAARHRAEARRLFGEQQLRLGLELVGSERWSAAVEELRYAVRELPSDPRARHALGRALLGLGDAPGALAELRLAAGLAPADADVLLSLARAYRAQGRDEDAARVLEAAERLPQSVAR